MPLSTSMSITQNPFEMIYPYGAYSGSGYVLDAGFVEALPRLFGIE